MHFQCIIPFYLTKGSGCIGITLALLNMTSMLSGAIYILETGELFLFLGCAPCVLTTQVDLHAHTLTL